MPPIILAAGLTQSDEYGRAYGISNAGGNYDMPLCGRQMTIDAVRGLQITGVLMKDRQCTGVAVKHDLLKDGFAQTAAPVLTEGVQVD